MKTFSTLVKSNFFIVSGLVILISFLSMSFTSGTSDNAPKNSKADTSEETVLKLNLRVHIMTDIAMVHSSGLIMESWVTPKDVRETIIPEVNSIWSQAGIEWVIESIIEEEVVKTDAYEETIAFIAGTKRDSAGHSDPDRLPELYSLMQPQNMSTEEELGTNLFHIYLFPFIGNTSQGNAMRPFNWHTVVGTWTNKFNRGGIPEKVLLTEDHNNFKRGSLSRTIAHEIGHVLSLRHNECPDDCLMGGGSQGYGLTKEQIAAARLAASKRI